MTRFHVKHLPRQAMISLLLLLILAPMSGVSHAQEAKAGGVETVHGSVTITSPFIGKSFSQTFAILTDLTAFVKRDLLLPQPSPVQITGNIEGDIKDKATFTIPLPIKPEGQLNNVGHDSGTGVQIYAIDFQVNIAGDGFVDPIEMTGWPTAITSLKVAMGANEVTGGKLIVWAPDDQQQFPTGFGADGKLFTEDDPVGSIPAGWTLIDLDTKPFSQVRDALVDVTIIEGDVSLKDLSDLTYTAAFDQLVQELRLRYPYTELKGIDWDALVATFRPEIEQAERANDERAFNLAMMGFAVAIGDGHVAVTPPAGYLLDEFGGGIGLALDQTDSGAVIVRCVVPDGPAARAGVLAGSEIVSWNGQTPAAALAAVHPIFSESTAEGARDQRLMLLPRGPSTTRFEVSWRNPDQTTDTSARIRAVKDPDGFSKPCELGPNPPAEPPVTVSVLPSGVGYIKVNSFADDIILTTSSWEWALRELKLLDVPALIVDIRANGGGLTKLPVYMAGSFYSDPYVLANEVFFDEAGNREIIAIDEVEPAPVRWKKPVAVLIGQQCVSACEIFAATIAHNPDNIVVGFDPTAGIEGGVYPWLLPGDISFRAPLIAFEDPVGEIFLEGTGVQPSLKVPRTVENLVRSDGKPDAVLTAAENALLPTGQPAATPAS